MVRRIWTLGHGNRSLEEFLELLKGHHIELLVDVRRFPTSKWPHFRSEDLRKSLERRGIEYTHMPGLGGFRTGGYVKHMETEEFRQALEELLRIARHRRIAIMCAERLFFRCHRRFIADALVARGWEVHHIIEKGRVQLHRPLDAVRTSQEDVA
jgi:uncharacterized protein (DUF488 family)